MLILQQLLCYSLARININKWVTASAAYIKLGNTEPNTSIFLKSAFTGWVQLWANSPCNEVPPQNNFLQCPKNGKHSIRAPLC